MIGGLLLATGLAAVAGWIVTGVARRYALAHALLDRPNPRSSHTVPVPRGGGLGIVLPALVSIVAASALGWLDVGVGLGLFAGCGLVACIGWLDDQRGLSVASRLVVQVVAAVGLVWSLGGFPQLDMGLWRVALGLAGAGLAAVVMVWSINLYNFMDGLDGIAGVEAIFVGSVGGAVLLWGGAPGLGLVAWTIAGASVGFLVWNRPPAQVFMGDVGSGPLGFLFAGLAFAGEREGAAPALVWVLLLGIFAVDATFTLLRGMFRGQRWFGAHRNHAYQRLVQNGWTHGQVCLAVLGLDIPLGGLALAGWWWRNLLPWALGFGGVVVAALYVLVIRQDPNTTDGGERPHSSPSGAD